MNVLILGGGRGSWQVRGLQLGRAIGARVKRAATLEDLQWADVVVCVKRAIGEHAAIVHAAKKPLVWDALDFWVQPDQNSLTEAEARRLLQDQIARYQPALTIGATQAMADACGGVYLPHHAWPGLTPAPVNTSDSLTVGYQGTRKYLGRWGAAIEQECARRGWSFVINPTDYRALDLVVAFRDGDWDGWMCREWKSGVKLVNALAAGRPIVLQGCAAAREIDSMSMLADELADLANYAFDGLASVKVRQLVAEACARRADAYSLAAISKRYQQILLNVCNGTAVAA